MGGDRLWGPCKVQGRWARRGFKGGEGERGMLEGRKRENETRCWGQPSKEPGKWGGIPTPNPRGRVSILILSSLGVKAAGAGSRARVPPVPVVGGGRDGPAPPATPPTGEGTALWGGMAEAGFHRRPHIRLAQRLTIHLSVRKRSHLVFGGDGFV